MVLPCVPATATPRRPTITLASAAARGSTASPSRRASTTSGLVGRIAEDTTTVSTSVDVRRVVPDGHPGAERVQRGERRGVLRVAARTPTIPRASMIRAIPLMPAPPMPTKCTRPSSSAGRTCAGRAASLRVRARRLAPAASTMSTRPLVGVGAGPSDAAAGPMTASRAGSVSRASNGPATQSASGPRRRPARRRRPAPPARRCGAARRCRAGAGRTRRAGRPRRARRRSSPRCGTASCPRQRKRGPCGRRTAPGRTAVRRRAARRRPRRRRCPARSRAAPGCPPR